METQKICPNCRKPLPPDVPLGLCPECLIKSGFPTESGTGVSGEDAGARFVPPPVEEIAQLFPQLEILGFIGKGGMGAVYKARQPRLDRFVALKVLPPAVANDSGFAERFNREARALARLSHPNIVAVHDFGKAGSLHYLLMEFVDGANLREVERAGKITPGQALAVVPKICEALQYAHDQGVVHRDIKPENILLDKSGRVKIADFGIAKMVGQSPKDVALTGAKDVVGTPHYMAPEQIEKPQTVDHRADIYSLGVVFYEMLTGELPLGKFALPSRKVHVDVRLDEVVLHTLEKEPSRRYQKASEVKTDVETITGTSPGAGSAASPPAFSTRTDPTASDKTILPAFLLAFFFGVFGPHRFYVGKIGTAFLQLGAWCSCILMIIACATTGATFQPTLGILLGVTIFGCIIWATVDWILILCKAFTDGQGRRITHWLNPQIGEIKTSHASASIPPVDSAARTPAMGRQDAGAPGAGPPSGGATPPTYGGPPPAPLVPGSASPSNTGIIVAPAVGLMIAALWKLLSAFSGALFLFPFTNRFFSEMVGGHFLAGWGPIAITGMVIFKVIPALFILFGAFQMLQLRSYAWSIAAGILAIISCSLISLPIGIWALIVLGRQDVRDRFTEAARNRQSRTILWPWILGAALMVPLLILILFAFYFTAGVSQVTVKGAVTDATTGKAIVGARVDDNRYGADADKAPAQAWTDANGRYELSTSYEEHTIAASAPGYETKLSLLRTKPFGSEHDVRMNFQLQPSNPITAQAALTNQWSAASPDPDVSSSPQPIVAPPGPGPVIEQATIYADKAVIEGRGATDGHVWFSIGKDHVWGCGFLKNIGFTAILSRNWAGNLNCLVKDADGNQLLTTTVNHAGSEIFSADQLIFNKGTVVPDADGNCVVGELKPKSGRPLPIMVSVRKANGSSSKESGIQAPATTSEKVVHSSAFQPVRIDAGSFRPFTDHDGNIWLPDQGFADGKTVHRSPDLAIVNTQNPELYSTERYGMTSFSHPVPNGKYVVELHFAETSDAVTGPGERVFTFIVEGHEFKNFDVWTEAGGSQRACVETVNADVTDGELNIRFIPKTQNPEINGIEILPVSGGIETFPSSGVAKITTPPKTTPSLSHPSAQRTKILGPLSTSDPFKENFSRTLPLAPNGRLQLDNINGRIEIAGWDKDEVSIKALKHGKTFESVQNVRIEIRASPDEISIHTREPSDEGDLSDIWSWLKGKRTKKATVDYAVQVPLHTRLTHVSSVNGRIEITDVSGSMEASSVNGALEIQGASGSVKLSTVNGRIKAGLDSLDNGQAVSLSTVNGHIEAILPSNANARVSASTVNGGMSSDFPGLIVKKGFPLGGSLKGTLGNGGATVTASSVNGRINFRRGVGGPK